MTLRDQRQTEFAEVWIKHGQFGILNLCPRFGKIKVAINIFNTLKPKSVLIAYPDHTIKESWESEFRLWKYKGAHITYTTHLSLRKYVDQKFDIVVLDEVHLLSDNQIDACIQLFNNNDRILGLTGTLSKWTEKALREDLQLHVLAEYPIEQGIAEGVIVDYEITVVAVPLDRNVKQWFGKKFRTEKQQFDAYSYIIDKFEREGRDTKFLRLHRMRVFQKSLSKLNKTRELLQLYPEERILVFCGLIEIAEALGIPSFHSRSDDKESFNNFINGEGNHMAVVKIGNTGVTYRPLNRVVINYFDSNSQNLTQKLNRAMGLEYDNPNKVAKVTIVTTNEEVEQKWLKRALEFFEESKIKYI